VEALLAGTSGGKLKVKHFALKGRDDFFGRLIRLSLLAFYLHFVSVKELKQTLHPGRFYFVW